MPNEVDQSKAYSEACNMLRHYSNASLAVRSTSVVQGLAILFPWANAVTQAQPNSFYVFILPVAGLIFTVLLFRFHMAYFEAAKHFAESVASMEQKFFDKDCWPMVAYNEIHKKKYDDSAFRRHTTVNAPFILIGTFFVLALIVDIVVFCF